MKRSSSPKPIAVARAVPAPAMPGLIRWGLFLLFAAVALGLFLWSAAGLAAQEGTRAIASARGADLYDQPQGQVIERLAPGDLLWATARDQEAAWVRVTTEAGQPGWVQAGQIILPTLLTLPVSQGESPQPTPTQPPSTLPAATEAAATQPPATPSPTPTPTPTAAPTVAPTPTAQPLPPLTGRGIGGIVRSGGGDLLAWPEGDLLAQLPTGSGVQIFQRTEDGEWLRLRAVVDDGSADATEAATQEGWMARSRLLVFGWENLPIVAAQPIRATATPAAQEEATGVAEEVSGEEVSGQTSATAAVGEVQITVTSIGLNVRSGPGVNFAVIAQIRQGERYPAIARNGDQSWLRVDLGEEVGWVSAAFTRVDGPAGDLPVVVPAIQPPTQPTAQPTVESTDQPAAESAAPAQPTAQPVRAPANVGAGSLLIQPGDGQIYVYNLASGGLRVLTGGFDPAISPDGRAVAFRRGGGENGIYVINMDGSNQRQLYGGGESLRGPVWSPGGEFVVFSRVTGQDGCRDVGFGVCLPDMPQLSQFPLVSRDRRTLSRVDINGENFRDLPSLNTASMPSWSDRGIAYQSSQGIQIVQDAPGQADETDNRFVVGDFFYQTPSWQPGPQGATGVILYQSQEGSRWEIGRVNDDGSGQTLLTRPSSMLLSVFPHNVSPVWSPDGGQIAFISDRDGDWAIYVMNADGSNQRPLPIDLPIEYRFQAERLLSWGR